jgi:hypothetical protein
MVAGFAEVIEREEILVAEEVFEPTTSGVESRDSPFRGETLPRCRRLSTQSIGPRRSRAQRIDVLENPNNPCAHERTDWWTHQDLNLGPLACEASALTGLSYASTGKRIIAPAASCRKSQPLLSQEQRSLSATGAPSERLTPADARAARFTRGANGSAASPARARR